LTGPFGNISYQEEKTGVPPEQSASVPVCSTESLPSPSRPTQNEEYEVGDPQSTAGSVQSALTEVKTVPVAAYPDQLAEVLWCGPWATVRVLPSALAVDAAGDEKKAADMVPENAIAAEAQRRAEDILCLHSLG
jgi:hypothetical protein